MIRQNIIHRLRYLRNWELFNIFFLPACLYFVLSFLKVQNWQPFAFGMFVVCFILAQGVFYWHRKLQIVSKREPALPSYFKPLFSLFSRIDVVLLSIYPVLAIYNRTTSSADFRVSFWSNALFLFAVLEYLNYYHYQLSHDSWNDIRYLMKFKKIRRSPLSVDLQKNQERSRNQTAG